MKVGSEIVEINDRTTVAFILPDGKAIEVSIRDEELRIEAYNGRLQITPWATNVVKIKTK